MSWLQGGLNRLLHPGSSRTEELPAAGSPSPTRTDKAKGLLGLMQKGPSPPKQRLGAQQGAAAAPKPSEQQQLADGLGNIYVNLPCIKQHQLSRSAALELYAVVLRALPGIKLDSSWLVYQPRVKSPAGSKPSTGDGYICILPTLHPPGYFCSTAAVVTFLQELQGLGRPLPGVMDQPKAPRSPASARRYTAAVTAALQSCGPDFRFVEAADSARDSTGSGDSDTAAPTQPAAAAATAGSKEGSLGQLLQPQVFKSAGVKRPREQQQQQQQPLGPPDANEQQQQQQHSRVLKRGRTSPAQSSLLDRKSSEASTPPMSSGQPPRSSPGAAAAAGQKAAPKSSNAVTSSGAAQKALSRGTAAVAAAAAGAGRQGSSGAAAQDKPRVQALAAELERLRKAQEMAQLLDAEAEALLQSDDAAVELLASLGGEQQGELNDIIMTDVPLLDVLGGSGHGTAAAAGSGAAAAVAAAAAGGQAAAAAAGIGGVRTGRLKPQRPRPTRASDSFDSAEDLEDLPDWAALDRQQRLTSPDPVTSSGGAALNRVDAKLQSIRRAAFRIGREPSMSAEMAAPRPGKAAAAGCASLPPRPKPRPSSSGGSGKKEKLPATNTFSAASDVKAMSKLDSLLRAKDAAAAIKAAVQSGLPYEGTVEQRHHAMRQQLRNQLPDGRVPCAEGLAAVQSVLSGQLPGARLDSEWLVYPATPAAADGAPKLDILIRHPRLTQGYFRSYKSAVSFYSALTDLLKASRGSNAYYSSQDLSIPGLSILPDVLQQQHIKTGRSPGEMLTLMNKALATVGRSFVKEPGGAGGVAAAAAASDGRRPSSPGDSEGMLYPVGGTKAAVANAMAVAARQWQKPPLVANLEPPRRGSSVLVLGMFYASEATAMESHNGLAQYRDRIRLAALHKQVGYIPLSFDRDHEVALAELAADEHGKDTRLHVQGNFNSKRGAAAVADRFPDTRFTAVFCDYFRMPSGYAGDIYKAQLFLDYIPELVRRGNLPAGVPIYIPNSPVLLEQLAASGAFADYGDVVAVPARCYPLYEATRHAEVSGLMPAKYSNAGQVRELVPGAEFIVVHYCGDATPPLPE